MATMIPDNVEAFKTDGEGRFYKFLETTARPDEQHIAWYTPDIEGKEPDFIFFSRNVGLIVFEVKDWMLDQIREANPQYFRLQVGREIESRKSPFQQARDYLYDLVDKIKADGQLIARDAVHHGNVKIPFHNGVVFPNINKFEWKSNGFGAVAGADKIFFSDDLHPSSDICSDPSGKCFRDALEERFAPQFKFSITGREVNHLKQLIFPTVKIELPERGNGQNYEKRIERIKVLDHNQEAIARKFDGGHCLIVGPSGSGKTLILAHKAAFLKQYNAQINDILFVCYNITLVNYIRRLLSAKKVPLGENGVTVHHFYGLCSEIIGEEVAYEKEGSEFYEIVVQEALSTVQNYKKKFDAILVDEGQDFSTGMFKVVTALLNPKTDNLTIALDDNQNIYRDQISWDDVRIRTEKRVHRLSCRYRNTKEISQFALKFIYKNTENKKNNINKNKEIFSDYFDFHGPEPEIKQFADFTEITEYAADKITEIVDTDGCPYSEIAVLYAMKYPGDNLKTPLPEMIEKALDSRGIFNNWVSEDYRSKKAYDITTNSVTISTIHSVKGLDYSTVFLLGLDFLEPRDWSEDQLERLTYVTITRARYQLFIPYIKQSELIKNLLKTVSIKNRS
jgi:superfamily I DNA and RNA helicase